MNAILEQINSIGTGFVDFAGGMLVQSSVLIVILLAVDFLLRKRVRAVIRYCLWMLVLVKLILPVGLESPIGLGWFNAEVIETKVSEQTTIQQDFVRPEIEVAMEPVQSESSEIAKTKITTPTQTVITDSTNASLSWQGMVFVVWAAVAAAMVLLLLQRVMFVMGLIAQAKRGNNLMEEALEFCREKMGMRGKIGLKISANATSPAVCGLVRPVILMPENLGPGLGAAQFRSVLMHELAHIKRGDLWVNLVQTLLQIVYFYNPLLWLANALIRRVREQAVDETVQVAMGEKAQQYPETLVNVAKLAFKRPALSLRLIGVVESKSALRGRVRRMLNRPIPKSAKIGIAGLLAVLVLGFVLLPMAQAKDSGQRLPVAELADGVEEAVEKSEVGFEVPEEFVGRWRGRSKIIVNWTKRRWLDIDIEIKPDGTVTGRVGDSELRDGVFKLRDWLTRLFNRDSNWMIRGDLSGPIIKNEKIEREYINLLVHDTITEGKIIGGFHTSGWHIGGKKTMVMSGIDMKLEKISGEAPEREKVSEQPKFIAELSNGVTVELVGICEHPSEGKDWWRPDGSMLEKEPYEEINVGITPMWGRKALETVIKINGFSDGIGIRSKIAGAENRSSSGSGDQKVYVIAFDQAKKKNETDIEVGIAADRWETVVTQESDFGGVHSSQEVIWHSPVEKDGKTILHTAHSLIDKNARVIAIDQSGEEHTGGSHSGTKDGLESVQTSFKLPLSQIKEFRFQTRPYEWVEFKNVSLKPNFKTDVQIRTGEKLNSSTGEKAASLTSSRQDTQIRLLNKLFRVLKEAYEEKDWAMVNITAENIRDVFRDNEEFFTEQIGMDMALRLEELSDDLHDSIRDEELYITPAYYDQLVKIWDEIAENSVFRTDVPIEVEKPAIQIVHPIDFEITKQGFLQGDSIEIAEILGTSSRIKTGQTYTVKGRYKLASHNEAMLHIYATNGETRSEQGSTVNRGSGEFTRTFTYLKNGWLHLSFYPAEGGSSFGNLYFAEKGSGQQVPDISRITSVVGTPKLSKEKAKREMILQIGVYEYVRGQNEEDIRTTVSLEIPLAKLKAGNTVLPKIAKKQMDAYGITLEEIVKMIENGTKPIVLLDVEERITEDKLEYVMSSVRISLEYE